ncbi:MAG: hypothetical protein HY046_05690 [Acidobacteria bacterium]|nr:hypothetical protein [Acidobacteriota bacterium]
MFSILNELFFEPFIRVAMQILSVIPKIFAICVILAIGGGIAHFVRHSTEALLEFLRFDRFADRVGLTGLVVRTGVFRSPTDFAARLGQSLAWLIIVLVALSAADPQMTHELVTRLVNYVPDVLVAILVLLLGQLISKFLARSTLLAAVNSQWPEARMLAGAVRLLVMSLAVLVALEQLRIGRSALLLCFAILFGGIVLSASIAFGLAARDLTRQWMEDKMKASASGEDEVLRHI